MTGIHKATPGGPGSWDERGNVAHCAVCGQRIKLVPGGYWPTWVHADSGAVAAPNPPAYKPTHEDHLIAMHRQMGDVPDVDVRLDHYEATQSDDTVKTDLELIHDACGQRICDVEAGDTLAVLACAALDHERLCAPGPEDCAKCGVSDGLHAPGCLADPEYSEGL